MNSGRKKWTKNKMLTNPDQYWADMRKNHPDLSPFLDAVSLEGELAGDWQDKPHRLIYDLLQLVVSARSRN